MKAGKAELRFPAEWEPHQATCLAWPHQEEDWPGKYEPIPWIFGEIVRCLARSEKVIVLCNSDAAAEEARAILDPLHIPRSSYSLLTHPHDRGWLRDTAPSGVLTSEGLVQLVQWKFTGWAKYDNHLLDQMVPGFLSASLGLSLIEARRPNGEGFVLEGGAIDADGQGTLLVTEECLLSTVQARNPGLTKEAYEDLFWHYLGVSKTLWLPGGIAGDDTHGHIDDIARFVAPGHVVLGHEEDPQADNFKICRDNMTFLSGATDAAGRSLRITTLPFPEPLYFADQLLPASYLNFYITNKSVLVPVYNDPRDGEALQILAGVFPGREIIGIYARDLVLGLGTLHCLTQQIPAGS